jgi:cytochrome P450
MDEAGAGKDRPPVDQVAGDTVLTIIAGSDTVAPALLHLFWLLLRNPTSYKRLQSELDEASMTPEDLKGLAQLPYLNAAM